MRSTHASAAEPTATRGPFDGDRLGRLTVLSMLGQAVYEADRGNEERAMLYAGAAVVGLKYRKASLVLQSVLTADRIVGKVTGESPLSVLLGERRPQR